MTPRYSNDLKILWFAVLPHFLPLSVSPICGAFFFFFFKSWVQRKKTSHMCDHHQEVRVRWELRQREVLNKQICSMNHWLTEAASSISDIKHQRCF